MRQEVDIRYVVTSLKGSAQHLYEDVYCRRGQMENLIKLHKAQLASDRMSCHGATANQVRLVLHTAPHIPSRLCFAVPTQWAIEMPAARKSRRRVPAKSVQTLTRCLPDDGSRASSSLQPVEMR